MKAYRPAKKRITVSVGESVRILRELQELSQSQLARLTGISQATISAIENDRVRLGVERAKVLARVLKCHPTGIPRLATARQTGGITRYPPDFGPAGAGPG
jgi:transcriptional regulator with XRE-family HTH domain